jgi:hypothetical protein
MTANTSDAAVAHRAPQHLNQTMRFISLSLLERWTG